MKIVSFFEKKHYIYINRDFSLHINKDLPHIEVPVKSKKPQVDFDEIPERLGENYRVLRLLSRGGMAKIYEGRREAVAGVSAKVAIKVISPEKSKDVKHQELFVQEAKMSSHLRHQNLIQIQDFDRQGDIYFLVMEYVEGITLRSATKRRWKHGIPVSESLVAEVGRQICEGLHHAHNAKDGADQHVQLVHRDIKPSNLMINKQGVLKILDFGISYESKDNEGPKEIAGTKGYMSPEQVLGEPVSPKSDLFSLGIVLYELCSSEPMFTREEKLNKETYISLLKSDIPVKRVSELGSEFEHLKKILIKALQRDPKIRYSSARDMGDALAKIVPEMVQSRQDLIAFTREVEMLADEGERELPPAFQDRSMVQQKNQDLSPWDNLMERQKNFSSAFALLLPLFIALIGFAIYTFLQSSEPTSMNTTPLQDTHKEKQVQQDVPQKPVVFEETKGDSTFGENSSSGKEFGNGDDNRTDLNTTEQRNKQKENTTENTRSEKEKSEKEKSETERSERYKQAKKQREKNEQDSLKEENRQQSKAGSDQPVNKRQSVTSENSTVQKDNRDDKAKIGSITIYSDPPGKVAIDGKFLSNVGIYDHKIPYGRHQIHIVYGVKIKKFFVTVDSPSSLTYIWSFKTNEWIRKPKD